MSYWKSKVLPRLKKLLVRKGHKDSAVAACRSFNKSKDTLSKEIEEKKEELLPKVAAIYSSSNKEAQGFIKEPTEAGVSEHLEIVQNLLVELSDAGCPGAQTLKDASIKHGPIAVAEPIVFLLKKISVFVTQEDTTPPVESSDSRDVLVEDETKEPTTKEPIYEAPNSLQARDL